MTDHDNTSANRTRIHKWSEIGRNITMIGQLGVSLVVPILMCMIACYFLSSRLGFGGWIYIPGLILGIGSSAMTAWKLYQSVIKRNIDAKDKDHQRGPSFNRHF